MDTQPSNPITTLPPTVRQLALAHITPSTTLVQERRRARYDGAALKELAANIKAVQVIEPIIVRPKPGATRDAFEIVAGERRWRASCEAGLDSIPAIIRTLDDRAVLEIQLIENLHREGLHELEEAEGYETLLREHRYDVEQLATKVGRSRAYVYGRMRLLALDKKSREAFYAGKLTAATALLLARIPVPALQQEALKAITESWNGQPLPYKEAQRHIQERYMTRLKDAPFDCKVVDLVPNAGACSACPKLTGNQPELFGDIKSSDVCTDPVCYGAKRAAWTAILQARAEEEGRTILSGADAKRIAPYGLKSSLQTGYASLDQRCYQDEKGRTYRQLLGKTFKAQTLIADADSGRLIEVIKIADHAQALKDKGITPERAVRGNDTAREQQRVARAESAFRERLFFAVRAKTPASLQAADLRLLAQSLWRLVGHESSVRLVKVWGWAEKGKANDEVYKCEARIAKLSDQDIVRFVIDCALIDEVRASPYDTRKPTRLLSTAARLKIDAAAVRKCLTAESANKTSGAKRATGGSKATHRKKHS
jgi:ParB/RepB/Spo0J family partition protein